MPESEYISFAALVLQLVVSWLMAEVCWPIEQIDAVVDSFVEGLSIWRFTSKLFRFRSDSVDELVLVVLGQTGQKCHLNHHLEMDSEKSSWSCSLHCRDRGSKQRNKVQAHACECSYDDD